MDNYFGLKFGELWGPVDSARGPLLSIQASRLPTSPPSRPLLPNPAATTCLTLPAPGHHYCTLALTTSRRHSKSSRIMSS
jgi:hypothetical protein